VIVVAWNNGAHHPSGAGYGLKVSAEDRDRYFRRTWKFVTVEISASPGQKTIQINTDKPSFWDSTCRELISKEIGIWLKSQNLAPWPKGSPPRLSLRPAGEARFVLEGKVR